MRRNRTWFALLSLCVLTALAAALALALIVAGGSVALANHREATEEAQDISAATPMPQAGITFTGMITDSHCGARHMRKSNMTSAECVKACYRKGASYILVDGSRRYTLIGGEDSVSKLVGERAKIIGSLQDDAIVVDSAGPMF